MTIYQKLEHGLKRSIIAPSPEFLHRVSGILDMSKFPIMAPDSNNEKYLSDFDSQIFTTFDSDGCNIFSGIHGVEMYANFLGVPTELSERFACVMAGLTPGSGSSEEQWETMITTKGAVSHDLWPQPSGISQADFFAPIPANIQVAGLKFLSLYTPKIRQVGTDLASLKAALKYGPVKIFIGTGAGWNNGRPNVIPRTSNPMGHAVLVTNIDSNGIWIYDQYAPFLKYLALDYQIFYAFQTLLIPKGNPNMSNAVFAHKPGTSEYAFIFPKTSAEALKDMALNIGREDIIKADGTIDFSKAKEVSY